MPFNDKTYRAQKTYISYGPGSSLTRLHGFNSALETCRLAYLWLVNYLTLPLAASIVNLLHRGPDQQPWKPSGSGQPGCIAVAGEIAGEQLKSTRTAPHTHQCGSLGRSIA